METVTAPVALGKADDDVRLQRGRLSIETVSPRCDDDLRYQLVRASTRPSLDGDGEPSAQHAPGGILDASTRPSLDGDGVRLSPPSRLPSRRSSFNEAVSRWRR